VLEYHRRVENMHPALQEVIDLHVVIEGWLGGTAFNNDAAFAQFAEALAEDFTIINPDGTEQAREPLVTGFRKAHGTRRGLRIQIRNARVLIETDALVMARYEEWQWLNGAETKRVSTVTFGRDPAAGNSLRWRALHETWKK
jgi:hypothetical protein